MGTLLEALCNLQTIEQELAHVRSRMRILKNAVTSQEAKIKQLEEEIRDQILSQVEIAPRRYSIMLHERGPAAQERVVAVIETLGELPGLLV